MTPPQDRYDNARQTAETLTSSSRRIDHRSDKATGRTQHGEKQDGNEIDANHHLLRPIGAAFDLAKAELKPLKSLEVALDGIIDHLDDLDAKCDAKLEELMRKKKAYLDATKMMQSAFK